MNEVLKASQILGNIQKLKGFTTKKQLADFFGVGPSAISDWIHRKGDRIPAQRLAEASSRHKIRWQFLAYGEEPPYEERQVEKTTGIELDPEEVELLEKIKGSPVFKRAVEKLLGLDETQVKLVTKVAESITPPSVEPDSIKAKNEEEAPFRQWRAGFPLTGLK